MATTATIEQKTCSLDSSRLVRFPVGRVLATSVASGWSEGLRLTGISCNQGILPRLLDLEAHDSAEQNSTTRRTRAHYRNNGVKIGIQTFIYRCPLVPPTGDFFLVSASFSTTSSRDFHGSDSAVGPPDWIINNVSLSVYWGQVGSPLPLGVPVFAKLAQYSADGVVSFKGLPYAASDSPGLDCDRLLGGH